MLKIMCDFQKCVVDSVVHVIIDDEEEYDLCTEHLNYEVEDLKERYGKGKIYADYAKQIISLEIPAWITTALNLTVVFH